MQRELKSTEEAPVEDFSKNSETANAQNEDDNLSDIDYEAPELHIIGMGGY